MLLTRPSSTHCSRASQVSENGGVNVGPGFTEVGLNVMTAVDTVNSNSSLMHMYVCAYSAQKGCGNVWDVKVVDALRVIRIRTTVQKCFWPRWLDAH